LEEFKMNIYKKDNWYWVYCHGCDQEIEIADLVQDEGIGLHCLFCGTFLGYLHDLPQEEREKRKWLKF